MALTSSQKTAVAYDQNLIIFAGPGSGKTSTFVKKAGHILATGASSVCLITFTTAAAAEMRIRMEAMFRRDGIPFPSQHIICGTFNALSLRHYQRHTTVKEKLLGPPARSAMLNTMLASWSKDERADAILTLERYQGALDQTKIKLSEAHAKFIDDYLHKLKAGRAIDLATVMRDCTNKMASGEIPLLPVTHLLGDEMQDADEVQLEFMLNHSRKGVITTLVADDDQTIYEWRSALGYAGLQHFAKESGAKTITLGENFRSCNEVVEHAVRLIAHNDPKRIEKFQKAVRGPGGVLGCLSASDLGQECKLVAAAIDNYCQSGETVAVLARTNRALDLVEESLSIRGIAYQREGPSIWDTPEVTTFVALLRALLSFHTADLMPVLLLLAMDDRVRKELEVAIGSNCGAFLSGQIPHLNHGTPVDQEVIGKFVKDTASWCKKLRKGEISLVLPDVKDALKEMFRAHGNEDADSRRSYRINVLLTAALDTLYKIKGSLGQRLSVISRLRDKNPEGTPVRLMTMHSSKGLEFDTVFLIDAKNPDDGSTLMDDHAERRLFYVAITRAKDRFAATYSGYPVKYIQESKLKRLKDLGALYGHVLAETKAAAVLT
jgi:DNA helicase-2/ATP-dependent DNA helicase PcrA